MPQIQVNNVTTERGPGNRPLPVRRDGSGEQGTVVSTKFEEVLRDAVEEYNRKAGK